MVVLVKPPRRVWLLLDADGDVVGADKARGDARFSALPGDRVVPYVPERCPKRKAVNRA